MQIERYYYTELVGGKKNWKRNVKNVKFYKRKFMALWFIHLSLFTLLLTLYLR